MNKGDDVDQYRKRLSRFLSSHNRCSSFKPVPAFSLYPLRDNVYPHPHHAGDFDPVPILLSFSPICAAASLLVYAFLPILFDVYCMNNLILPIGYLPGDGFDTDLKKGHPPKFRRDAFSAQKLD
jgi:hypothetical protein